MAPQSKGHALRPVVPGVGMLRDHGRRVPPGHERLWTGIADGSGEGAKGS